MRYRAAALILAVWTVYGLVHAVYWITTSPSRDQWGWMVVSALIMAWTWAALTPFLFGLARIADPARIGWLRSLTAHGITFALVALGMGMLRLTLIMTLGPAMETEWQFWPSLWPRAVFWADVNLFTYLAVVLTGRAIASHRRYLDRTLRTHVLETQLARAQLHFLELQLQPHFLFNSLNAIQELAHEAPNAAERMLRRLHALLSRSLERSGQDEHSLAEELSALEPYIDIQRTRFEWLMVGLHVNADTRTAMVPHLILQPLVENAIRHGLAVRQGPGHIEVFAERRGDRLVMQVRDDGVGLSTATTPGRSGIGLRNASDRLRQLYGHDHRFELRPREHGGVVVEIDIPFRTQPTGCRSGVVDGEPALARRDARGHGGGSVVVADGRIRGGGAADTSREPAGAGHGPAAPGRARRSGPRGAGLGADHRCRRARPRTLRAADDRCAAGSCWSRSG